MATTRVSEGEEPVVPFPRVDRGTATSRRSPLWVTPVQDLDLDQIYRRYGGVVFRRILRFYDRLTAEEILQEIFVKVMTTQSSFRGESSIVTWLYQITTRHCLNRRRNERRRRELMLEHGEPAWGSAVQPARQEASLFLEQLWSQLDPELAEIGVYYFVDGLSHDEIAKVIGVSRRTVGNRIEALRELARKAEGRVDG